VFIKKKGGIKMKKIAIVSLFLLLVIGFTAGGAQALSFNVYNNYTAWLSAIAPSVAITENFEDTTLLPGFSITEINGAGSIHDGVYENIVDKDTNRYQIFNFAGMKAWGGWLDLKYPGGAGTGIDVYIDDDNTFLFNVPNTYAGEFVGIVLTSGGSFDAIRFQDAGGAGIQETYYSIDMAMAKVPEPATMFLLGLGLFGIGIASRKKS